MDDPNPIADNEAIYDEQIDPLMVQIIAICKANQIPMIATFQYAPDEFCTSCILPKGCDENLVRALAIIKPRGLDEE